ncbi:muscle M-line assembly protein unc-89-like [Cydia fagiglandana]|uniref:muscle M-line assembly protein unc-89-like n=1 Tax=Cydia fagiglandana TaxID=1458189 RepID=UPI002FEE35AF
MKNVSSVRANSNHESPKTPGGISKSLLTPCRRVGLSRNWKKKGPSPFISPLASNASNNVQVVEPKKESRKRKSVVEPEEKTNENVKNIALESVENECEISTNSTNEEEIVKTPSRHFELPRRKKSKTFLATLNTQASTKATNSTVSHEIDDCTKENEITDNTIDKNVETENPNIENLSDVVKDVSLPPEPSKKVNKGKKFKSPLKTTSKTENTISVKEGVEETPKEVAQPKKKKSESKTSKTRSPNELTKECIVVIQKKLLKVKERYDKTDNNVNDQKKNSQPLFDSDDEAPLSTLNKNDTKLNKPLLTLDNDDDEFIATSSKNKNKKIESKKPAKDSKIKTQASKVIPATVSKVPSQSSFDEDDDDFFDKKKTILFRKTYDKVSKVNKAKSTGSITQADIDNIKARIEVKKKMLLARAMTADTEELRELIKKWQKGCQEALVELMDMMRLKCPDKHGMDYSEILQMLKIPPSLVGYDSDHDCFNTPDDSSAVLSKYNDF